MITVSKANKEDLIGIKEVDVLSFAQHSYPILVLRQFLDISGKYFLIAKEDEKIIGYTIGNCIAENQQGWILSLAVHPDARGKQIGKRLTEKIVEALEDFGCTEILLTVHPENLGAKKIYEGMGFVDFGYSDDYYLDGEERVIMRRGYSGLV